MQLRGPTEKEFKALTLWVSCVRVVEGSQRWGMKESGSEKLAAER